MKRLLTSETFFIYIILCSEPILTFFQLYEGFLSEQKEAIVRRCSVEKVFLEILQNSKENTCPRVFYNFIVKFLQNTSGGS